LGDLLAEIGEAEDLDLGGGFGGTGADGEHAAVDTHVVHLHRALGYLFGAAGGDAAHRRSAHEISQASKPPVERFDFAMMHPYRRPRQRIARTIGDIASVAGELDEMVAARPSSPKSAARAGGVDQGRGLSGCGCVVGGLQRVEGRESYEQVTAGWGMLERACGGVMGGRWGVYWREIGGRGISCAEVGDWVGCGVGKFRFGWC
jgi:hypothetical protein